MGWGGGPFPLPRVINDDDHVTVVDKPEVLITVGDKMEDLWSVLPFILRPPAPAVPCGCRLHSSGNPTGTSLPRPVHRLDHCTRGTVFMAKTYRAAAALRRSFADFSVRK